MPLTIQSTSRTQKQDGGCSHETSPCNSHEVLLQKSNMLRLGVLGSGQGSSKGEGSSMDEGKILRGEDRRTGRLSPSFSGPSPEAIRKSSSIRRSDLPVENVEVSKSREREQSLEREQDHDSDCVIVEKKQTTKFFFWRITPFLLIFIDRKSTEASNTGATSQPLPPLNDACSC